MKKRGQNLSLIFSILIALIVLTAIFFLFNSTEKVIEQHASAEIINLQSSIQAKVLQQSVRPENSMVNASFSVPAAVEKICFFDSNLPYDPYRNPEVVGLYADDTAHNLFIFTQNGFFPYSIKNLNLDKSTNPLCLTIKNNKINLNIISKKQKVELFAQQSIQDNRCISVLESGSPDKKIDMVFLGYGFKSTEEYSVQVNKYVNNILLEFPPYNNHKDKFNFYRIDDSHIECTIGDFIKCDQYEIKVEASDCPNDLIVLLVDRSAVADFVSPVRSSAIGNIVKINTADKPFVLVHELGHSLGNLADEYVDENYYSSQNFNPKDYPNCDMSPCTEWTSINGTSCYEGCSLSQYFRPTKESIMRTLVSPTYGPVNEKELIKRLMYYE